MASELEHPVIPKKRISAAKWLGVMAGLYVASYIPLTLQGAYGPSMWGLAKGGGMRPRVYDWAPAGFYDTSRRMFADGFVSAFYAPLWKLDKRYWHDKMLPEPEDPQHPAEFPSQVLKKPVPR